MNNQLGLLDASTTAETYQEWQKYPPLGRYLDIQMNVVWASVDTLNNREVIVVVGSKHNSISLRLELTIDARQSGGSAEQVCPLLKKDFQWQSLPEISLVKALRTVEGGNLGGFPRRVSHKGKTIALMVTWQQFTDLRCLISLLVSRASISPTVLSYCLGKGYAQVPLIQELMERKIPISLPFTPEGTELNVNGQSFQQAAKAVMLPVDWFEIFKVVEHLDKFLTPGTNQPDGQWLEETAKRIAEYVREEQAVPQPPAPPEAPTRKPKLAKSLPNLLEGLDAFKVLQLVQANNGSFEHAFNGTPIVLERLRKEAIQLEKGQEKGPRSAPSGTTAISMLTEVVKGRLVFGTHDVFNVAMRRRYAARGMLRQLKRLPPYHLPDIHVLSPAEFGQVPGFVAGQHRQHPDRLCAVMLTFDESLFGLGLKERKARIESSTAPKLWVFPRQWLVDLPSGYHWYDAGLFGTPDDPAIIDFITPVDDYQI